MTKPHRAHELMCKIGADTRDEIVSRLHELAREIERGGASTAVIGGYSSGAIFAYRCDPTITHDDYFRELDAMWEHERQEASKAAMQQQVEQ